MSSIPDSITKLLNSQKLDGTLFGVDSYKDLWRDRLEYSKRNLSRATDELDPSRGILRRSSFVTFWGVPIVPETSDINPNVGFALGLLWTPRPSCQWASPLITRQNLSRSRRPGFPTWSWTSLHADVYQGLFGNNHNMGVTLPAAQFAFQKMRRMYNSGVLRTATHSRYATIPMSDSPILPEYSRELLVKGDIIRVRRSSKGLCELFNEGKSFEPDVFDMESASQNIPTELDALVLIQWVDAQHRRGTKRFVLMLLHWIDKNHAERIGLLTHYRDELQCDLIHNIPRVRKRFILH
ncbi:MAG: hypothetical protein Q9161_004188 [Pseudevernia consocians]